MFDVTFITGNQSKADYLAKYLGFPVGHKKLELEEIQTLDLRQVVEHKLRQAYGAIHAPVLVNDQSLEFEALGRLPGTFIRFYVDEVPFETICRSLDKLTRGAIARSGFGYFDGEEFRYFEGTLKGTIADHPEGQRGYGWDQIFIPEGYDLTRASMDEASYKAVYTRLHPFSELREFLASRQIEKRHN